MQSTIAPRVLHEAAQGGLGIGLVSFLNIPRSVSVQPVDLHLREARRMNSMKFMSTKVLCFFFLCLLYCTHCAYGYKAHIWIIYTIHVYTHSCSDVLCFSLLSVSVSFDYPVTVLIFYLSSKRVFSTCVLNL